MKKPTEAIEWLRAYTRGGGFVDSECMHELLAYLDSIHEWPADLTRERLEGLASNPPPFANNDRSDALRRLAAVAPRREKRMVDLWWHDATRSSLWAEQSEANRRSWIKSGWRKVGEAEIDA